MAFSLSGFGDTSPHKTCQRFLSRRNCAQSRRRNTGKSSLPSPKVFSGMGRESFILFDNSVWVSRSAFERLHSAKRFNPLDELAAPGPMSSTMWRAVFTTDLQGASAQGGKLHNQLMLLIARRCSCALLYPSGNWDTCSCNRNQNRMSPFSTS